MQVDRGGGVTCRSSRCRRTRLCGSNRDQESENCNFQKHVNKESNVKIKPSTQIKNKYLLSNSDKPLRTSDSVLVPSADPDPQTSQWDLQSHWGSLTRRRLPPTPLMWRTACNQNQKLLLMVGWDSGLLVGSSSEAKNKQNNWNSSWRNYEACPAPNSSVVLRSLWFSSQIWGKFVKKKWQLWLILCVFLATFVLCFMKYFANAHWSSLFLL